MKKLILISIMALFVVPFVLAGPITVVMESDGTAPNYIAFDIDSFVIEGDTADDYELTWTPEEPTADRTVTLPDYSGGIPSVSYTHLTLPTN